LGILYITLKYISDNYKNFKRCQLPQVNLMSEDQLDLIRRFGVYSSPRIDIEYDKVKNVCDQFLNENIWTVVQGYIKV
jgi:hypothetical protein